MNSIYAQIPALVNTQPEGSNMASYIIVTQQIANVILVLAFKLYFFNASHRVLNIFIGVTTASAVIGMVVLAASYDTTATFGNSRISILLMLVALICGISCGSSNIVCWGFMAPFPHEYTLTFSVGLGVSSAFVGVGAILQDAGGDMRFSVNAYFAGSAMFILAMLLSFLYLMYSNAAEDEVQRALELTKSAVLAAKTTDDDASGEGIEHADAYLGDLAHRAVTDGSHHHGKVGSGGSNVSHAASSIGLLGVHCQPTDVTVLAKTSPIGTLNHDDDSATNTTLAGSTKSMADTPAAATTTSSNAGAAGAAGAAAGGGDMEGLSHSSSSNDLLLQSVDLSNPIMTKLFKLERRFLIQLALISGLTYGVLPSFMPYVALNYPNGGRVYNLANAMLFTMDPVGRLLMAVPYLKRLASKPVTIGILLTINIAVATLAVILGSMSPEPLNYNSSSMGVLPIFMSGFAGFSFAILQTMYFLKFHQVDLKLDASWTQYFMKKNPTVNVVDDDSGTGHHLSKQEQQLERPDAISLDHAQPLLEGDNKGGVTKHIGDNHNHHHHHHHHHHGHNGHVVPEKAAEAVRTQLFKFGGMIIQIGCFIGAIISFFITVVFALIPDPVER